MMNNKRTSCRQPANDARIVSMVETHCVRLDSDTRCVNAVEKLDVASLQTQPQPVSVETRFIASSSPHFPPYLINKTTSVASRIPSSAQPYYLIYYMKGANKGIRLDVVCTPLATEVVSSAIRSKIRYGITLSLRITNEEM